MTLQLSKRQQERNEKILRDLLTLPGNNKCADCGIPNPSWASYNLGIFLCVRCAAIHRKLGTHISKVRSPTLDKWTPEMINSMKTIGNTLSNQRYNPANKTPSITGVDSYEDVDVERFIRDKYERKTLMKARKLPPLPAQVNEPDKSTAEAVRSPSLGSNSSTNLRVGGNRVSGESFERAKSPASTNSSLEAPPPNPPRPGVSRGNSNPFEAVDWTGLEGGRPGAFLNPSPSTGVPVKRDVLYAPPTNGIPVVSGGGANSPTTSNPFGTQGTFAPMPAPAPLPPVPQAQFNPFNPSGLINAAPVNQMRSNSLPAPQPKLQAWNSMPFGSQTVNGQLMSPPLPSPNISPATQRVSTMPPSPGITNPTSPNPFIQPQQPSISPTNPFFPISQTQPPPAPTSPFQPQYPQPAQSQFFNPQTSFQQQQQTSPTQPFAPNQPTPNIVYSRPRLDNQSILSLYNTPPPNPTEQFIQTPNQNGVPTWNHQ